MTSKLKINVFVSEKLETMKIYLKQKQILRCSMKIEIVGLLEKCLSLRKKVRLGFLYFWSFSVAVPVPT
jgi:hypothetical protein